MGLACTCKSEGLVQCESCMKMRGEKVIKKGDPSTGSGLGSESKIEAMQQTHRANFDAPDNAKHVKTAIKQYTMCSDTQRTMEQKD